MLWFTANGEDYSDSGEDCHNSVWWFLALAQLCCLGKCGCFTVAVDLANIVIHRTVENSHSIRKWNSPSFYPTMSGDFSLIVSDVISTFTYFLAGSFFPTPAPCHRHLSVTSKQNHLFSPIFLLFLFMQIKHKTIFLTQRGWHIIFCWTIKQIQAFSHTFQPSLIFSNSRSQWEPCNFTTICTTFTILSWWFCTFC